MADLFKAVILGIVEGLTEFLPISSTGHLILFNQWFVFAGCFTNMFNVVIQLGAILAVIFYFGKRLSPFGNEKSAFEKQQTLSLWGKAILGIVPMTALGLLFHERIERYLFNPGTVATALVIGGILLFLIENQKKSSKINSIAELNYPTALLIGLVQCLAMIPGTSRSAATIIGAMLFGCSRVVAAEFSFFLAIPTMIAASGYYLLKSGMSMDFLEVKVLATGFLVSFGVAWLVIAGFMNFISKRDLKPFAYYRIVLGILIMLYFGIAK
jgi:undecaprenyl-diphosphatase